MASTQDQADFESVVTHAWNMSRDVDGEVEEILAAGRANPLPEDEARRLLTAIANRLVASAKRRGDAQALASLPQTDAAIATWVEGMIERRRVAGT